MIYQACGLDKKLGYEKDIFDKAMDGVEPLGTRMKSFASFVNEAK